MKKINILLITALACSFTFFSCGFSNLQVPKEVKVRTDATYEFSVMNFDSTKEDSKFKVSDYFDLGKILEEKTGDSSTGNGMNIYKYNDGSQFQQFLIHMPLEEIRFDFSESLKDMDLSNYVQSFNIDKQIEIPDVGNLDKSEDIDLRNIMTVLNGAATFTSTKILSHMGLNYAADPAPFTSITYTSGTLRVTATGDVSGTLSLYHNLDYITSAPFVNNVAELPLEGKTLYGEYMYIDYSGTPDEHVGFTGVIDSSSVIYSAEGVNLDSSQYNIPPTEVTFDINVDDNLKEILIEQGSLAITISTPSDWSPNVIGNYSIQIDGAISPALTVSKGDSTTDNLNGKYLQEGQLKATATVPINISGGKKIVFANPPLVQVTTNVAKITAEVEMPDNFKTDISEPQTMGPEVTDYVNSITWKNQAAGFKVTASNNLPNNATNKMTLSLTSTELGITDTTPKEILPGVENQELFFKCGDNVTTTIVENKQIDVNGHLGLTEGDHSTASKKTIKIAQVAPGVTYNISLVVDPVFEWAEANIKLPADKTQFNDNMNTGLNRKSLFSVLGEDFGDKVKIKSMPLYLYANIPSTFGSNMSFKGTITAKYGDKASDGSIQPLVPSVETAILPANSKIEGGQTLPPKMFELNENKEITYSFANTIKTADFADAMNLVAPSGTLWIDYNVGLDGSNGGVDVTREEMDALQADGKSNVKIDIVVLLSMDFEVNGSVNIDMMDIAKKKDSDLLGRSEPTDTSAYDKYLQVVKSAAITVDNFMLPMSGDVALKVDLYKDGSGSTKEVGDGKSFSLEVNPGKLLSAEQYPLCPDIQFVIGKEGETTNFGILRTMPISGKIKLKVKAKGDIPVYPFSEQN